MSFGASGSLRFDVGNHGKDQGIFWQAGSQKKPAKKFGYKKKEMKYPLRKVGPAETIVEHKELKNNKQSNSRRQNFVKKNKENTSNLMRTKDGISKDNGGFYTLTHKQLNAILQSVGKIASLRGEGVNIAIDQALALQDKSSDPLSNELLINPSEVNDSGNDENKEEAKGSETLDVTKDGFEQETGDNDLGEASKEVESPQPAKADTHRSVRSEGQSTTRSETKNRKSRKQKVLKEASEKENEITEVEMPKVKEVVHRFSPPPIPRSHMTKAERFRLELRQSQDKSGHHKPSVEMPDESVGPKSEQNQNDPKQKAEVEKRRDRNPLTNSRDEVSPVKFHIPPLIPKAHLTMAEKKRLQWEIERGETINTPPSTKKTSSSADKGTTRVEKEKEEGGRRTRDHDDDNSGGSEPLKVPIPKAHLSQAERKRLQWEMEKAEQMSVVNYDPWGRPGAGAPIRTHSGKPLADYKSRKEQALRLSVEARQEPEPVPATSSQVPDSLSPSKMTAMQSPRTEPAAMRSSFAIGFIAPNEERFKSTKEDERRKWLEDLEKQREEKRLQKIAEKEKDRQYFEETWADKLTHAPHPPAPLPDQPAHLTPMADNSRSQPAAVLTPRVGSAPQASGSGFDDSKNYTRGQGSLLDPSTRKEMEEKRKRHLEHQAAVLAQVEENQRLKRLERERKIQEELEEERKLQQERDSLQNQYKEEQKKSRLKEEARQQRLLELKNAMDEAHYIAQQEKHSKRMQHLQQGGHDIKRLQATIEANLTPRPTVRHVEPTSVPGLDLTPRPWHPSQETSAPAAPPVAPEPQLAQTHNSTAGERYHHEPYTENRVLTPSMYRKTVADPLSPRRDFSTQTDSNLLKEDLIRQDSEVSIVYKEKKQPAQNKVRVRSSDNVDSNLEKQNKKPPMGKKGPLKISERPKWGTQNQKQTKNKKQSERDPFYQRKMEERQERRAKRERELLALVEANKRVIPGEKGTGQGQKDETVGLSGGTDHKEHEVEDRYQGTERSGQYDRQDDVRGRQTHSPPLGRGRDRSQTNHYRGDSRTTVITTHGHSPPIPALRHKMDVWKDTRDFENDYQLETHSYPNYHTSRSGQTQGKPLNSHYQDDPFEDAPFEPSDFIPFTRTSEILDPGRAAVPVIVSRESSAVTRARNEYHKGQQPGHHGNQMEYIDDKKYQIMTPVQKDPILNPNVVKGHPTPRQDLILQQLSHLKLNLMQRQRELETCMSPSDLTQAREESL